MKAVIYPRVSTLEQAEGTSLEVQERICREWCAARGIEVVRVFLERGESAKTADRKQLLAALTYIRETRDIDFFVVYRLDRFARQSRDYFNLIADLAEVGCRLVSATEPIDHETPAGRLMASLLAAQAQFDNEVRAERARLGMQQVVRRGGWAWRPPIGFRLVRRPDGVPTLTHDPVWAPIVRRIFEDFARDGTTQTALLRHAASLGLRVSKQTLRKMLANPVYCARVRTRLADGGEIKPDWEPIVSRDTWDAVQARLAGSPQRGVTHLKHRPEFILKGYLYCAQCGRKMTGYFATGRHGRRYPYYGCPGGCSNQLLPLAQMNEEFEALLERCHMPADAFERFRAIVKEHCATAAQKAVEAERAKTEARARAKREQEKLLTLLLADTIDEITYRTRLARIQAEVAELDRGIAADADEFRDLDATLSFARIMLLEPLNFWRKAGAEVKLAFLALWFSGGIAFDRKLKVRTALKLKAPETSGEISGAGLNWHPSSPDIRTAIEFLRRIEDIRRMCG
ncbi:MAG: recombinase family protein [Planctomycetota bacterium]|nr:recombinase family protein [Planctomycetota bacterium]